MELFLTILKFAGIFVSGALGILGTVTRTHDEVTMPSAVPGQPARTVNRMNRWGKCALALTITGALTAVAAQFAETVISYQAGLAAQKRTEEQIRLARGTLASISRDMTRFDAVSLRAVFELPQSAALAGLRADLRRLSREASTSRSLPAGVVLGRQKYSRQPELLIDLQKTVPAELTDRLQNAADFQR